MKKPLKYECPRCIKKYKTVRKFKKMIRTCNNCGLQFGIVIDLEKITVCSIS